MAKKIFTVSIDEELAKSIKKLVRVNRSFRNQSHFVEEVIKNYLEEVLK